VTADLVSGLLAAQDRAEGQASFDAFNRATGMGAVRDPYLALPVIFDPA